MKRNKAVWVLAAVGILLSGCAQTQMAAGWKADTNSIYVNRGMEVESAMVYTSEKENDTYNQAELQAFAETAVVDYNTAKGQAAKSANEQDGEKLPVALKSAKLEGKTGTLVFEYGGSRDFVEFAGEVEDTSHTVAALNVQKVSDAVAAGELTGVEFVSADGNAASAADVEKQGDAVLVSVEGVAHLFTEGAVLYRTQGAEADGTNAVRTAEGKNIIIFQ